MAKTARSPFAAPVKRAPTPRFQASASSPAVRDRSAEQLRAARQPSAQVDGLTQAYTRTLSAGPWYAEVKDPRTRAAVQTTVGYMGPINNANRAFKRSAGLSGLRGLDAMSPTMWGFAGLTAGALGMWAWLTLR
jgi:hypothetical protein